MTLSWEKNFIFWFKCHLYKLIDHNMIKAAHLVHGMLSHRFFRNHGLIRNQTHGLMGPGPLHPFWTLVRRGSCIVGRSNIWSSFSKWSPDEWFASAGRTVSSTARFYRIKANPPHRHLGWAGRVSRMHLTRLPVSFSLESSPSARGYAESQKRCFKAQLKTSLTHRLWDPGNRCCDAAFLA